MEHFEIGKLCESYQHVVFVSRASVPCVGVGGAVTRTSNEDYAKFYNHGEGPSWGLLCDCEIFENLRLTFV